MLGDGGTALADAAFGGVDLHGAGDRRGGVGHEAIRHAAQQDTVAEARPPDHAAADALPAVAGAVSRARNLRHEQELATEHRFRNLVEQPLTDAVDEEDAFVGLRLLRDHPFIGADGAVLPSPVGCRRGRGGGRVLGRGWILGSSGANHQHGKQGNRQQAHQGSSAG